jgi:hypothetical protein
MTANFSRFNYISFVFLIERILQVIFLYNPSSLPLAIICQYCPLILLPNIVWLILYQDIKYASYLTSMMLLLVLLSAFDSELIITNKFITIVSLKYVLAISIFISIYLCFSVYRVRMLWSLKKVEFKDITDLTLAIMFISSFFVAFASYKQKILFYSLGDYYQTLLYVPEHMLQFSFCIILLSIIGFKNPKLQHLVRIIFLFLAGVFLSTIFVVSAWGNNYLAEYIDKIPLLMKLIYFIVLVEALRQRVDFYYYFILSGALCSSNFNNMGLLMYLSLMNRSSYIAKLLQLVFVILLLIDYCEPTLF